MLTFIYFNQYNLLSACFNLLLDPFLQPLLVQACFHGDPDEVRALLYKKEDVNYQASLVYL